ncbi:MAG TPA: hemolysin family protein, partial [Candidatus Nitrosocosmicus sp.]|nr:hemolysin family protein [Candidatus Nitrosocosmicus sp.]
MDIFLKLSLVVILILLNGFFVASEFALVAVRKTRIEELAKKGRKRAKLVKEALKDLDIYISATQLGITLASLGLGWIGEPVLSHIFAPFFQFLPSEARHGVSAAIAFTIITFLHIVIGEVSPKTIALQKAEPVALFIITPLLLFSKIFKPFIYFLNESGNIVVKALGFNTPQKHGLVHSEEEIRMIINQSQKEGVIEKEEVQMVHNVFKLADVPISKIMSPKENMVTFSIHSPL